MVLTLVTRKISSFYCFIKLIAFFDGTYFQFEEIELLGKWRHFLIEKYVGFRKEFNFLQL